MTKHIWDVKFYNPIHGININILFYRPSSFCRWEIRYSLGNKRKQNKFQQRYEQLIYQAKKKIKDFSEDLRFCLTAKVPYYS